MPNYSKQELNNQLKRQASRLREIITGLDKAGKQFSYIRLGYFTISVLALYMISQTGSDTIFFTSLVALLIGFIYLISRHKKITDHRDQLKFLKAVKRQHIARMELDWENLSEYTFETDISNHPFAEDLHVVGNYSLHHLMDTAIYEGGTTRLAEWLLNENAEKNEIIQRQTLLKELIPLNGFRDRLQVQAFISKKEVSDKDWGMEQLLKWMKVPRKVKFKGTLLILSLLSIANIVLLITVIAGITGPWVLITFLSYLGFYNFNSHKIIGLFDAAYQIEKQMQHFGSILLYIEQFDFREGSNLRKFFESLKNPDESPSLYLKKVVRLAGAASLQTNQVLWPLVNMVIPWDMYFSMKMENLKVELEPRLSQWLNDFYELEAMNSIANFTALNPEFSFPEITADNVDLFKAENLGHPLIPNEDRVTNDFEVKEGRDLFLITGSNMAGKSTFLRTVGVNLVLAFAGGPVNASSLSTNLFRLFTSINVKDSLGDGLSHFYAEVKRLRRLLDELDSNNKLPLFFFVDEIFKGTNNRERFQGSTAFLKNVAGKNGVGMISTHDLELASLEKEIPELSNWHFAETIEGGKMSFEYKIKEGPCPTTNALKIM
ncbi:MAG: MutS family DNA mismatch repair protein, partial [Balneolaceae bacterium]